MAASSYCSARSGSKARALRSCLGAPGRRPDGRENPVPCPRGRAHADAGAELLVGGFEPRRNIDGIAIGGVVEEAAAAEISDNRRAGMHPDPGGAERDAFFDGSVRRKIGRIRPRPRRRRRRGAAWSGCSPGAPNSTCKASPTIFATVPSWANTISVMPVRYSLSSGPSTLGSSVSTSAVKLAMSVNSVAISRRCPSSSIASASLASRSREVGRKVPRQRSMRPFRRRLALPRVAQQFYMPQASSRWWFPDRRNRSAW